MSPATAPPLVSVGLPVYNGARFLDRALRALRVQDHADLEIIVSDNGSTDTSLEIARAHADEDPRVIVLSWPRNKGAAWNYNVVLAKARGRFFKWAAHDDLITPTYLSRCLAEFSAAGDEVVLVYPRTSVIDDTDAVVGDFTDDLACAEHEPADRLAHLLGRATEYHPIFGLIRRDVLLRTGGIQPFPYSDVALLVELCLRGSFLEIPERLFLRRFHADTSIKANPSPRQLAEWFSTSARQRRVLPTSRVTVAFVQAVRRAPLTPAEKTRCLAVIATTWTAPRWRVIGGEVRRSLLAGRPQDRHSATTSAEISRATRSRSTSAT